MKNHIIDRVGDTKRCIPFEKNIDKRVISELEMVSFRKNFEPLLLNS